MFDGGFTGTPHLGVGLSKTGRDYRLGWRLTSARRGDPGFRTPRPRRWPRGPAIRNR